MFDGNFIIILSHDYRLLSQDFIILDFIFINLTPWFIIIMLVLIFDV